MQSKDGETHRFWRDVGTWVVAMVVLIVANFIYSRVNPSYHNPFFKEPIGMTIVLGIPTIMYWFWTRRHLR